MFLASFARKLALMATIASPTWGAPERVGEGATTAEIPPPTESVRAVLDGWRRAEAYATAHPGCEVFIGRGDSMLPLYRDHTVLVVRPVRMQDLRPGMTVVFIGDRGNLVAHTLLENTRTGWRAMGMGNREADRTVVRHSNLVGVVVKAYAPALPGSVLAAQ